MLELQAPCGISNFTSMILFSCYFKRTLGSFSHNLLAIIKSILHVWHQLVEKICNVFQLSIQDRIPNNKQEFVEFSKLTSILHFP